MSKTIFFLADAQSIHIAKWVDYFVAQNYIVHLATFSKSNYTQAKNIYFLSSREKNIRGNYYYVVAIPKLAKLLKKIKPDVINAHYSYSMGFVALLAKKIAKIDSKFTVVCHGSDILVPPYERIMSKINMYVLKNSDKVFAVSSQIKDKIETYNISSDKIFVGQYGIDLQIDKVEKDIDIISNRAYYPNSRIDDLLIYLNTFQNINLKIVFVLPNIKDDDLNKLKKTYSKVIFYKHLDYNTMIQLVNRSKIYISGTKSDGTSLSLMEAMSLGCIPLVSDIVSNRSWVLDGVNGYLFYNKEQFEKKLRFILENYHPSHLSISSINEKIIEDRGRYAVQMKKISNFLINYNEK